MRPVVPVTVLTAVCVGGINPSRTRRAVTTMLKAPIVSLWWNGSTMSSALAIKKKYRNLIEIIATMTTKIRAIFTGFEKKVVIETLLRRL
jgi:hypothetical protein